MAFNSSHHPLHRTEILDVDLGKSGALGNPLCIDPHQMREPLFENARVGRRWACSTLRHLHTGR